MFKNHSSQHNAQQNKKFNIQKLLQNGQNSKIILKNNTEVLQSYDFFRCIERKTYKLELRAQSKYSFTQIKNIKSTYLFCILFY